jgi:hypothetical protein
MNDSDSAVLRSIEGRVEDIFAMLGGTVRALKQVDRLVARYQVIQQPGGHGKKLWSKVLWAKEVPGIRDLKQQLMFHANIIDLYLSNLGKSVSFSASTEETRS